jgi:CRISPR-associated protein Cas1
MGTVFIDQKEIKIKTDGNSIAFYSKGKKTGSLPIAPLKRVIIVGNVNIETSVIHKLIKKRCYSYIFHWQAKIHRNNLWTNA